MQIIKIDIHPKFVQPFYGNQNQFSDWVLDAALGTEFYLNKGSDELKLGDYLKAEAIEVITGPDGNQIGQITHNDETLISVIEVQDTYAIARIESFGYKFYFERTLPKMLTAVSERVEFMDLFPYQIGQELTLISREESKDWKEVRTLSDQLSGEYPNTPASDVLLYQQIIEKCNRFIETYKTEQSYFLPDAYYQKGFALHKIKRFEESNQVFKTYLKLFPKGMSAQGANSWINENNQFLSQMPKAIKKTKILFLASNPVDSARLRIGYEIKEIDTQLRLAKLRDQYDLESKWALTPAELLQILLDYEPDIVHFSGHGEEAGIYLEDKMGNKKLVSTNALSNIFKTLAANIKCVILNACYSKEQALEIAKYIPFVIGMNEAIPDETAIGFAVGFYKGIGAGKTIPISFELGKNMIELEGYEGVAIPEIIKKN